MSADALQSTIDRLAALGVIPGIAPALEATAADVGPALRDTILAEVPAFTASGNPDILPELGEHAGRHVERMIRILSGGSAGRFRFVQNHARLRAVQHFPLEATLHAYRCGHQSVALDA